MNPNTQERSNKQKILAFELSLIIASVSTVIIYLTDRFILKHNEFSPLTEFQFYGVIFIVVLGLVLGLLFYREEQGETVEEETHLKMKKKKKARKGAKR